MNQPVPSTRRSIPCWLVGVTLAAARSTGAEIVPLGPEFLVNTYTTGIQSIAAACRAPAGDFVVVWRGGGAQDGSDYGIFGQRFASAASPVGTEFQVNAYTTGGQQNPAICCDAGGDFVVAWSGPGDQSGYSVRARRFASSGAPQGTEFQVNTYTTLDQFPAAVACDAAGAFVVVWQSGGDGDGSGVFGQRFASDGTPAGGEFRINAYTTANQGGPSIVADPGGNFTVVWSSFGEDGHMFGAVGARFASTGAPLGGQFVVNSYTTGQQQAPRIARDPTGAFVVVWASQNQDGSFSGVFGQRFASDGVPRGGEFQVNAYTTFSQGLTTNVALDADGTFVVAWANYLGDYPEVFARRFDADGAPLGTEFQANTYTTMTQGASGIPIVFDGDGGFVIAWQSFGPEYGIFARHFAELCGNGALDASEQCDDDNRVGGDCCSATCMPESPGSPCGDDGVECTTDACDGNAACIHSAIPMACPVCQACDVAAGCVPRPRSDCRHPRRATLLLANGASDAKDRLAFAWKKGAATTTADLGNPPTAPGYTLCIFDRQGNADRLVLSAEAPAGAGWKRTGGKGFRYRSRAGDLRSVVVKSGRDGKALATAAGKGAALGVPALGLTPPVEAQLQVGTGGACFAGTFAASQRNTASRFKAKGD